MDGNVVWKRQDFCGMSEPGYISTELLEINIPRRQLIANCGGRAIKAFSLDGKEIWSCVVADLLYDEYGNLGNLEKLEPVISHFVIRNGVIIFACCIDWEESHYAIGISIADGACLWKSKILVKDFCREDKSKTSRQRIPFVGNNVVFAMDICKRINPFNHDYSDPCLWILEFSNGDFSCLDVEKQTIKIIPLNKPGVGVDGLMMYERMGEKEIICVANREIIHFDSKYDQKLLHSGGDGMIGCNSFFGEVFTFWDTDNDIDYVKTESY